MAGEIRRISPCNVAKAARDMPTACLDRELPGEGIRVLAARPGRMKTAVRAVDADIEPADAARAFAEWVDRGPADAPCGLSDVTGGGVIEW